MCPAVGWSCAVGVERGADARRPCAPARTGSARSRPPRRRSCPGAATSGSAPRRARRRRCRPRRRASPLRRASAARTRSGSRCEKLGRGDLGVHPRDELVAVRAEDLDHAEVVLALLALDERLELGLARPRAAGARRGCARRSACRRGARSSPGRLVVGVGDLAALLERAVDLQAEPRVDRLRDEERRDDEQARRSVTIAISTNAATNLRLRCEPRIPRRRSKTSFPKLRVTTKIRSRIRITITRVQEQEQAAVADALREARDRGQEQEAADRGDQHDADPELAHAAAALRERKRRPRARGGQRTRVARGFVGQGGSSSLGRTGGGGPAPEPELPAQVTETHT